MAEVTPLRYFSCLYLVDIFQTPISFTFAQRKKRPTMFGVFCSLFMIIFLIINFSQSDIFRKKSPYVMSQTITYPQTKPIFFDDKHLLYVSLADAASKNYIDPRIFTVTFDIYHISVTSNAEFVVLDKRSEVLKPCTVDDVYWDHSVYVNLGMKNALCLQNKTYMLRGFWDESEVYYAKAQLYLCNNATSNNTCKTPAEINQFFATPRFFTTKFHGVTLQMNDFENPFKTKFESVYQLIDLMFMKRINIFFKNSELTTDDGWFFSAKYSQSAMLKDTLNYDSMSRASTDPVFQLIYYASHDTLESSRRYQSLSEALASISGVGNFLFLFFYFFISIQTYIQTMNITLNSLYYFPNCERRKKDKIIMKSTTEDRQLVLIKTTNELVKEVIQPSEINSKDQFMVDISKHETNNKTNTIDEIKQPEKKILNDSFVLQHFSEEKIERPPLPKDGFSESDSVIKESVKKIGSSGETKTHPLNVRYCEYIFYAIKAICPCKKRRSKKDKLYRKADKIMIHELDVISILQRLHEIEKLKLTLLNKDQLMIFNSITKPLIFVDDEDKSLSYLDQGNSAARMSKMIRGYKSRKITGKDLEESITKLDERNPINERLMNLMNKQIKKK